jgi:hypothetical protein
MVQGLENFASRSMLWSLNDSAPGERFLAEGAVIGMKGSAIGKVG